MVFRFCDHSLISTKCLLVFGTVLISCRITLALLSGLQVTFELSNKLPSDVIHRVSNSLMNQISPKWIIRHYGFQYCILFTTLCPWISHKPHILRNRVTVSLRMCIVHSVLQLECNVFIMKFAVIMAVNTVLNIMVLKDWGYASSCSMGTGLRFWLQPFCSIQCWG